MSGRRQVVIAFAVLTVVFAALLYRAEHETETVNERVSRVESPCLKYAAEKTVKNKRLCEESFEKAVLTITHPEACAILRKAGLEIKDCAGARLRQERGRHVERAATAKRGDASQPGSTGSQPPSPSNGGHVGGHNCCAHAIVPASPGVSNPPSEAPSTPPDSGQIDQPSAPVSESKPEPSPAATSPSLLSPTVEALPEPVKPVVETVCSAASRLAHLC